ncbi:MAG: GWxTD domain-containing protein [Cyclobacteriaceae bacterium]
MRRGLISLLIVVTISRLSAQSLSSENLAHLYNSNEIGFRWRAVKEATQMRIYFALSYTTKNASPEMFTIQWEDRNSYSQRQGDILKTDSIKLSPDETHRGEYAVDIKEDSWLLVMNVTMVSSSRNRMFTQLIESNYPVNGKISDGGQTILDHYLAADKSYTIDGPAKSDRLFLFYYSKDFPSPFPPFSKQTGSVDPLLLPDSSFNITNHSTVTFSKKGLYLVQADTNSAEGFSFRIEANAFPKYTRIEDLADPMVFVSTQQEFEALKKSGGDKLTFDKTVMGITRDKDRAKRFMRSYFSHVEEANQLFTSFKEGWKTDQGMLYIIFGPPDEVRVASQNEIWYYKDTRTKFVFLRKGSVYDPNYLTMMRDDKYTDLWFGTIDLWRKSRF